MPYLLVLKIVQRKPVAHADDNADVLKKRLEVYHESTAPILPYYGEKGNMSVVDGMQSIESVSEAIDEILGSQ